MPPKKLWQSSKKFKLEISNYWNSNEENYMPNCSGEMTEASEKLAKDFPMVREDFYIENIKYIFGERPFYAQGIFFLKDWALKLDQN